MLKFSLPLFVCAALFLSVSAQAQDVISTVGEYNGPDIFDFSSSDYPMPLANIGDFTFTLPGGASVIGGTISGTFGNNDISSTTALSDYFVDGQSVLVAGCDNFTDPCSTSATPTAWSYTFSAGDLATLQSAFNSGSLDFNVIQNFAISVQTGVTTLDLQVSPEPATIFIFCGGLAGIALWRRTRQSF